MRKPVYIKTAEQISIQRPLCEEWIEAPVIYDVKYTRSLDPDFKQFLSPIEARRMGKILKRALATSLRAIEKSGIQQPQAIITGTGLGCIENTELFLDALCREGEEFLKPTHFMQSTHNTISSLLAIHTKTRSYNVTYAHKGISFDSALYDAWMQFMLGKIGSALVGGHDEMTPSYFTLLQKAGYLGTRNMVVAGEAAVSVMLTTEKENAMCEIAAIRMLYRPTAERIGKTIERMLAESNIQREDIAAIVTGVNGNKENDIMYSRIIETARIEAPCMRYKHIFGESYTASGLGLYAAAHCIARQQLPQHMIYEGECRTGVINAILLINHSDGKTVTFTLIKNTKH